MAVVNSSQFLALKKPASFPSTSINENRTLSIVRQGPPTSTLEIKCLKNYIKFSLLSSPCLALRRFCRPDNRLRMSSKLSMIKDLN